MREPRVPQFKAHSGSAKRLSSEELAHRIRNAWLEVEVGHAVEVEVVPVPMNSAHERIMAIRSNLVNGLPR